ncbi:MAG: hypothetical protein FD152_2191 [Xanthobacteraceae bacterium]|nr:MAG: hypothetical protein FD152_2191 [Xanthobacteraceae bacterium]
MADADTGVVEPDRRQKPSPSCDAPAPQDLRADTVRSAPLGRTVLAVLVACGAFGSASIP